jgi:Flp pilus assembly protein TadD
MASVSLTMIVKDEAAHLEACVSPIVGLVDELVIADTGSTDDTVAVAERLGARVVHFPWCDSFAGARNAALEHAKCDWAFILDADDRVVPPEREKLRALFAALGSETGGYLMGHVCLEIDGGVGTEVEQVRLFRRRADVRWSYRVHEQIGPAVERAGGKLHPTGVRIVHLGFRDPTIMMAKLERNLRLVELDCAERPEDPFPQFYWGSMLADLGRHAEAIVALCLCQPLVDPRSGMGRTLAYCLCRAQRDGGQIFDALETIRAIRSFSQSEASLACLEAEILIELGDVPGAGAVLVPLAASEARDLTAQDLRLRALLGEIMVVLGHHEAAEHIARRVTELRPAFGPPWLVLADALLGRGRDAQLDAIAVRLGDVRGAGPAAALIDAARLLFRGEREKARQSVARAMIAFPEHTLLKRFRDTMDRRSSATVPLASCLLGPWARGSYTTPIAH